MARLISFCLAKVFKWGYFFSHSSDSHIVVPLILKRVFTDSSFCNSHNSCWHCSDTAGKSTKSGWVNQENNSIASTSWNLSLKLSAFPHVQQKLYLPIYWHHIFLTKKIGHSVLTKYLFLHKLRNVTNRNVFVFHRQVLHWLLGASKHGLLKIGRSSKNKLSQKYSLTSSHKLCHLWSSGKSFQIHPPKLTEWCK